MLSKDLRCPTVGGPRQRRHWLRRVLPQPAGRCVGACVAPRRQRGQHSGRRRVPFRVRHCQHHAHDDSVDPDAYGGGGNGRRSGHDPPPGPHPTDGGHLITETAAAARRDAGVQRRAWLLPFSKRPWDATNRRCNKGKATPRQSTSSIGPMNSGAASTTYPGGREADANRAVDGGAIVNI